MPPLAAGSAGRYNAIRMATTRSHKDVAQGAEPAPPAPEERRRRRGLHRFGTILVVLGAILIVYAGVILFWGDPITWVYAEWRQHELAQQFKDESRQFGAEPAVAAAIKAHGQADARTHAIELHALRQDAVKFSHEVKGAQPFGRLTIGRIGLKVVVVQGTDWLHDLSQGPGHYSNTHFPGQDTTVAIAGHRTTFGAWFRNINDIRDGDWITLQMPYATFHYRVQYHQVVPNDDWKIIRPQGYERLVLSACHPLYSSSHRWVVYAKGMSATLKGGATVSLSS
jgi:sortase A